MDKNIEKLVQRVILEGYLPGVAQEVMGNRNYFKGFEFAVQATSRKQFGEMFDSQVVGEYSGPWAPKARALDGARAAVRLRMSSLSEEDIAAVSNGYKNPLHKDIIIKLINPLKITKDKERKY